MADTGQLKTIRHELVKQYLIYDVNGRMTTVYEARVDVDHGEPCLKTSYTYDGASTRIQKRKEEVSTWDSSYDM